MDSIRQIKFESNPQNIEKIGKEIDKAYLERVKSESLNQEVIKKQQDMAIVFSPIHGTGVDLVPRALKEIGFNNVQLVEEQCEVDGNFPTVVYPNPEEQEAMKMSLEKAKEVDAELVMATDPDGDRVGIAVKNNLGEYVLLNGNQTGTLIFYYLLEQWEQKGLLTGKEYIVKTVVTTYLIDRIAKAKGVNCYNVLTGFKYIGSLMTQLQGKEIFIAGAEESYGYLIGDHVRDKDAVVACTIIAEMCAWYKQQGKSLYSTLHGIYQEYGFFKEELISIKKEGQKGAEEISNIMKSYRKNPPKTLGGYGVTTIKDYLLSEEKDILKGSSENIDLPKSNVLQFITEEGFVISARPSGTEPKIKFYISVNRSSKEGEDYVSQEKQLNGTIDEIKQDLMN